jgi:selenocysteine lyase/cysteine desulfurase
MAAALFGMTAAGKGSAPAMPDNKLLTAQPEEYWKRLRDEQFLLPGWRAFMNNGSLGVAPRRVVEAVADYLHRAAALLVDDYPRWGYELLEEERAEMAAFCGCKRDELALVHNATEAMSLIAAGLDLKAGDEVVMTDQEHPSGRAPWHRRAQRDGVTVREVPIPLPPKDPGQLADLMISAIGPRTRVLSFSGILTTTGLVMPVKEICAAARAKGVISVVDGAHMHGQIATRVSDFGCDYFAGSPHKWMFAPAGCGLLYIREENLDLLWPTIVTGDWDNKSLKAARFMRFGTNNRAIFVGLMAGLEFLKDIGPEAIYARTHELARMVRRKAAERPWMELLTPDNDGMYGALVSVSFRGANLDPMWRLLRERKIWTMIGPRLRISTHIHTRPQDIDLLFATMDEASGHKRG